MGTTCRGVTFLAAKDTGNVITRYMYTRRLKSKRLHVDQN